MKKEKSKKKILFYYMNGYSAGGSDQSLYLHILNLNRTSFLPIIIYRKKSDLVEKLQKNRFITQHQKFFSSNIGVPTKNKIKIPGSKTITYYLKVILETIFLSKIILKNKVDILHVNNSIKTNLAAVISGLLTFRKVIVHDRMGFELRLIDKLLLKHVHKIIAISETVKAKYEQLEINREKIITIYNGLDIEQFKKKSNNIKRDITIGYVGRLVDWKGVDVLINSFVHVNEVFENAKLIIVGDGRDRLRLEELAKELGLQNKVVFLGNVDNVNEIYGKMDIFVHTAIEPEPFGRVIIEAMASGLPVISTNIGGPTEIITDGRDGFLVEPGIPKILAEKIIFLIKNSEIRKRISQAAILTARTRFDIKVTTKYIESVYRSL